MKMIIALFTSTALLISIAASAGEGKISGGGGTVVVCKGSNGLITSIHLADLIEPYKTGAKNRDDFSGLNELEIVDKILKEIKFISPIAGLLLQAYRDSLFEEKGSFFEIQPSELKPFDVTNEILNGHNLCKNGESTDTRLVAYQNFFENKIYIDSEIWNHHEFSTEERAALLLHEIWYSVFHNSGDFTMVLGAENIYPYVYFFFYNRYEFARQKLISDSFADNRFRSVRP